MSTQIFAISGKTCKKKCCKILSSQKVMFLRSFWSTKLIIVFVGSVGLFSPGIIFSGLSRVLWAMSKVGGSSHTHFTLQGLYCWKSPVILYLWFPQTQPKIFIWGRFISLKGVKKNFVFECSHSSVPMSLCYLVCISMHFYRLPFP